MPRTVAPLATGSSWTAANTVVGSRRVADPNAIIGPAVPRPVMTGPGSIVYVPGAYGFYPWAYGGLGLGFYYGGYDDTFYDPSYGGNTYPAYFPSGADDGGLRLKVKPPEAAVFVDGAYAGIVDEFDGVFQRLHVDAGFHRIEIRLADYESLVFDVRIEPNKTITYHGELRKTF